MTERLLTDQELAEQGPPEAVRLPLDLVDPNPQNPRQTLVEVDALAENIKTFGLLQPVTVRRAGDRYELLGGHRRRAAVALLREQEPLAPQWRTIAAVVRSADDEQADLMLISAQVHSRAWKPREEAAALERLLLGGRNLRQVGEALNRTESWASKRLRIYADAVLSGYVQTGKLPATVAEELLTLETVELRREYAERAADEHWSQSQARAEVRKLKTDRQIGDLDRSVLALHELLSSIEPSRISPQAFRNLYVLEGAIVKIRERARAGQEPVMPTIEEAQRAAGVRSQEPPVRRRPGRSPRRPGYKPRI